MPTVLRASGYRFFFYSNENGEPCHIHVQCNHQMVKFWLRPVSLATNTGFAAYEIKKLIRLVERNQQVLEEGWHEFFGK